MSSRSRRSQRQSVNARPQRRASQKFAQILAQERQGEESSDFDDSYSSEEDDKIILKKRMLEQQRLQGKSPSKPNRPSLKSPQKQQQAQQLQRQQAEQLRKKEEEAKAARERQALLKRRRESLISQKMAEVQESSEDNEYDQGSSDSEHADSDIEQGSMDSLEFKKTRRSARQAKNKKYDYSVFGRKSATEVPPPEKRLRSNPPRQSTKIHQNSTTAITPTQVVGRQEDDPLVGSARGNNKLYPKQVKEIQDLSSRNYQARQSSKYKNKDVLLDDELMVLYERDRQRWKPQMANAQKVPDAPVFRPTEEEFSDPVRYIESISEKAKQYGICQVVPPATWDPPPVLQSEFNGSNKNPFKFHPKKQLTSFLCLREADDTSNVNTLKKFNEKDEDNTTDEFGFQILNQDWSLEQFEKYANWSKKVHFSQPDPAGGSGKPTVQQIESEFWRAVETPDCTRVEALYGQDIESKYYGSGFPLPPQEVVKRARNPAQGGNTGDLKPAIKEYLASQEKELLGNKFEKYLRYSQHPWNLNKFPFNTGSILQHIQSDEKISGVQVPWVYVGSLMASFCWHIEDHSLYSINYIHYGDEKVWYGVPEYACYMFEEAMKDALPHLFKADPHLLHRLITMVSPNELIARKVPVYRIVHTPRSFVVTFPNAYHCGFNCGYNFAEAVNFAPSSWLPIGTQIVQKYRNDKRPLTFSFDQLLLQLIFRNDLVQKNLQYILEYFKQVQSRADNGHVAENGETALVEIPHSDKIQLAQQIGFSEQLLDLIDKFESMPSEHWSMLFDDFVNNINDYSEYNSTLKELQENSSATNENNSIVSKQKRGKAVENGVEKGAKISKNLVNTITDEVTLMASAQLQNQVEEFKEALLKLHTEVPNIQEFFMVGNMQIKDPETDVFQNTYDADCEVCQTDLYQSAVVSQHLPSVAASVDHFEYLVSQRLKQIQTEKQITDETENGDLQEQSKEGLILLIRYTPQQLDFLLEIVKMNFPQEFEQCCQFAQKMIEQDNQYFQQAKKIKRLGNIQSRILLKQNFNIVPKAQVPDRDRSKIRIEKRQRDKIIVPRPVQPSQKTLRHQERVRQQEAKDLQKLHKRLQKNLLYGFPESTHNKLPYKLIGVIEHENHKDLERFQKRKDRDLNQVPTKSKHTWRYGDGVGGQRDGRIWREPQQVQFISNRDYGVRQKINSLMELQTAMACFSSQVDQLMELQRTGEKNKKSKVYKEQQQYSQVQKQKQIAQQMDYIYQQDQKAQQSQQMQPAQNKQITDGDNSTRSKNYRPNRYTFEKTLQTAKSQDNQDIKYMEKQHIQDYVKQQQNNKLTDSNIQDNNNQVGNEINEEDQPQDGLASQEQEQAIQPQEQEQVIQTQDQVVNDQGQQAEDQQQQDGQGKEEELHSMLVTLFMHPTLMEQVNNDQAQIFMQSEDENQAVINIKQSDGNTIEIKLPQFVGNYQISVQQMTEEYMANYKEQHQDEPEVPVVQVECSIQEDEQNVQQEGVQEQQE